MSTTPSTLYSAECNDSGMSVIRSIAVIDGEFLTEVSGFLLDLLVRGQGATYSYGAIHLDRSSHAKGNMMIKKRTGLWLAIAFLGLLGSSLQAGVVTHNSYEDDEHRFIWRFNWTGETDGLLGFTMSPPGQKEWIGVDLEFNFENGKRTLKVDAQHSISPPDDPHSEIARILSLVVDVHNLAYTTSPTLVANGTDAVKHDTHSDWMYIRYERPFGSNLVQFEVKGEHVKTNVLPEPASGLVAAGLLGSAVVVRFRKRRLAT